MSREISTNHTVKRSELKWPQTVCHECFKLITIDRDDEKNTAHCHINMFSGDQFCYCSKECCQHVSCLRWGEKPWVGKDEKT